MRAEDFGKKGIERRCRQLMWDRRGCRHRGHGLIIVGVVNPGDFRRVQEFAVGA